MTTTDNDSVLDIIQKFNEAILSEYNSGPRGDEDKYEARLALINSTFAAVDELDPVDQELILNYLYENEYCVESDGMCDQLKGFNLSEKLVIATLPFITKKEDDIDIKVAIRAYEAYKYPDAYSNTFTDETEGYVAEAKTLIKAQSQEIRALKQRQVDLEARLDYLSRTSKEEIIYVGQEDPNHVVLITNNAYQQMIDAGTATNLEIMGLIAGHWLVEDNVVYTLIKDVTIPKELYANEIRVGFNQDSFLELMPLLDGLEYEYILTGWYHTHPGHTVFMSEQDVTTQKRMFKHNYQIAVVFDPTKNPLTGGIGVYTLTGVDSGLLPELYKELGFRIIPDSFAQRYLDKGLEQLAEREALKPKKVLIIPKKDPEQLPPPDDLPQIAYQQPAPAEQSRYAPKPQPAIVDPVKAASDRLNLHEFAGNAQTWVDWASNGLKDGTLDDFQIRSELRGSWSAQTIADILTIAKNGQ